MSQMRTLRLQEIKSCDKIHPDDDRQSKAQTPAYLTLHANSTAAEPLRVSDYPLPTPLQIFWPQPDKASDVVSGPGLNKDLESTVKIVRGTVVNQ